MRGITSSTFIDLYPLTPTLSRWERERRSCLTLNEPTDYPSYPPNVPDPYENVQRLRYKRPQSHKIIKPMMAPRTNRVKAKLSQKELRQRNIVKFGDSLPFCAASRLSSSRRLARSKLMPMSVKLAKKNETGKIAHLRQIPSLINAVATVNVTAIPPVLTPTRNLRVVSATSRDRRSWSAACSSISVKILTLR